MSSGEPYIICLRGEPFRAFLVDTLKALEPPSIMKLNTYYGKDYPKAAERPVLHDRLVFRKEGGGYVIMPDIPRNKGFYLYVPKSSKIQNKPETFRGTFKESNPRR
jgi:hypothetical protein